ncbi:tol-pal system protein YbgF [Actibacterium sp. MT2.3-13A]|uniref:tol-pal system protein YbgF n=1 Tax=Actibacterium sp. MT2.3-13A TaxID=2828332 RepID=UPI001BA55C78|nr:tol-pal system protein YbgF [Actibacterium sp. MT2.3-13A]
MRTAGIIIGLCVALAGPVNAQSRAETLADIRQEMSMLYVEVQRLKRELSTTGLADPGVSGGTTLQRVDAIEAALQHLTAKTEELEFRINRIVRDGTNRIGDLEFRLVELEGGDVSKLGETTTLGGEGMALTPEPASAPLPGEAELAMSEQDDFDAAKTALEAGNHQEAADLFAAFTETYPGGPLSGEAHFLRGEALSALGDTPAAARAYLQSFSGAPDGPHAPQALYRLGAVLGELGQTQEACVTLGEVGVRFPGSEAAAQAEAARGALGCL